MKRPTLIAGLTVLSIGAATLGTAAFAEDRGGKGRHHGPRFNFEEVDTNSDGKIIQEEMRAYQAARFTAADTNGDGKLSGDELSAQHDKNKAERAMKRQAKMMEKLDTDGDGMLSQSEMTPIDAGKMFEKLDKDGDGALSEEEIKSRKGGKRHGNKSKDKDAN